MQFRMRRHDVSERKEKERTGDSGQTVDSGDIGYPRFSGGSRSLPSARRKLRPRRRVGLCVSLRVRFACVAHGLFAHGCSRVHVVYRHARIRRVHGCVPTSPRGILGGIFPRCLSDTADKRELLRTSRQNTPCVFSPSVSSSETHVSLLSRDWIVITQEQMRGLPPRANDIIMQQKACRDNGCNENTWNLAFWHAEPYPHG